VHARNLARIGGRPAVRRASHALRPEARFRTVEHDLNDPSAIEAALAPIVAAYPAVALYGSVARGEAARGSDVDVLAVARHSAEQTELGRISLTVYEEHHLVELARGGSLFVLHLREEARVLKDPTGAFARIFRAWTPPDLERTLSGMRAAAAVLDGPEGDGGANEGELTSVALYIVRSVLYLRCLERGTPAFGGAQVAAVLGDGDVRDLLERSPAAALAPPDKLRLARALLMRHLGEPLSNPFGTLEALAVSCRLAFPLASDLALRVATGRRPLHYATAPALWWC